MRGNNMDENRILNVLKYFVSHGADVHAKNNEGRTALDVAKIAKKEEVVEYLSRKN
jgi:ankyrin repeat protein